MLLSFAAAADVRTKYKCSVKAGVKWCSPVVVVHFHGDKPPGNGKIETLEKSEELIALQECAKEEKDENNHSHDDLCIDHSERSSS